MGTTLAGREDSLVDTLLEVLGLIAILAEEDQASTRTTKSLVTVCEALSMSRNEAQEGAYTRSGGHDITVLEGVCEFASSDKTACVCNVRHQKRAVLVSDSTKSSVVPVTGVCRGTTDQETRLEDFCLRSETLVVDEMS